MMFMTATTCVVVGAMAALRVGGTAAGDMAAAAGAVAVSPLLPRSAAVDRISVAIDEASLATLRSAAVDGCATAAAAPAAAAIATGTAIWQDRRAAYTKP